MVNDSNMQRRSREKPIYQVKTTEMSDRKQNQSSRQALMASIRARRSFIEGMDSSSDMNPYSAVVTEDALAFTAQAFNKTNDEELSGTHTNQKENCAEI